MRRIVLFGALLALLGGACTSDTPEQAAAEPAPTDALQDTLDRLLSAAPATYPLPDPFPGEYANDPAEEGFHRRLTIDSGTTAGYRVSFLATEMDGQRLCRHIATFERVDTFELRGRIEGNELRIRAEEAALEVWPVDPQLRASPGLLCPGASIFGWWLPQWFATADWADSLAVPTRDEWLAPKRLTRYNQARSRTGQPGSRLRYETEILTRGDYDGDGAWDYAALLRDTSGRRGLYVRSGARATTRWEQIADLTRLAPDSSLYYPPAGLTTPLPGELPSGNRILPSVIERSTGMLIQYYDSTAVFFYLEENRWRRIALPVRSEPR